MNKKYFTSKFEPILKKSDANLKNFRIIAHRFIEFFNKILDFDVVGVK